MQSKKSASVKFDLPREESREFPRTEVKLDEPPPTVKFDIPDMKLNEPKWEGFKPKAYNDIANNATIGYGTLLHMGPITEAEKKLADAYQTLT